MIRSECKTMALAFGGVVAGAFLVVCLVGATASAQVGPVRARPEAAPLAEKPVGGPTLSAAAPSRVVLTPGGTPVIVTLRGTQVEGLSGAEAIKGGQPRREIAASLKYVPGTALVKRSLTLSAWPGAEPGEYQIRLLGDGYAITVPPEILQVVVGGEPPKVPAPAASAPVVPAAPAPKAAPAEPPKPAAEPPPAARAPAAAASGETATGSAPAVPAPAEAPPAGAPAPAK